ncbi:hypothetical protein HNP84_002436 [Thermocatellispora tengchongensis]|uniref:Integral membrane protein n=2 Tax=Thermocatellispora tengchongensis TaxID=1073253 RepID=A0A840P5G9_9ACTN|nr:hypothetical protein [Thermocatellispora tengchongensis]
MSLVIAAVVLALEGLIAVLLGGYVGVQTVVGAPEDVTTSIAVAAFGLLAGAGLLWVAYGAFTAERWSRSPGVLAQIFLIPVSITLIQSAHPEMGIPLIIAALTGLAALLSPPTTRALYGDDAHHPS